ncbi:PLDc N-terminal domain-containing protein [Candidatus Woesearchaeota archaeon]|nr:PLDc N-terminal domain-containing protein [Candidatus Woesearchaeota archaeon]
MKRFLPLTLCFLLLLTFAVAETSTSTTGRSISDAASIKVRNASDWGIYAEGANMVNQVPDPAEPGSYVDVRFKVENVGLEALHDVVFELLPRYPFSLSSGASSQLKIGDIDVDQVGSDAYILHWRLHVDKNAVEGNSPIYLRYSHDNGNVWSELPAFSVRVQTRDAVVLVDDIVTTPDHLEPGKPFTLSLTLHNTADSWIKDLSVKLDLYNQYVTSTALLSSEFPFTPFGSTNEQQVKWLDGSQQKTLSFPLVVDHDTAAGIYKLPVNLIYYDSLGKQYNRTFILGLPVNQKPSLWVTLDQSVVFQKGMKGKVTLRVNNIGDLEAKYIILKLKQNENYTILSPSEVYVGNIEGDDYETADYTLYLNGNGKDIPLDLELRYGDKLNTEYSDHIIGVKVPTYTSSEARRYGLVQGLGVGTILFLLPIVTLIVVFWLLMLADCWKKQSKEKRWIWIVLLVLANILGAVLYYIIGRKK